MGEAFLHGQGSAGGGGETDTRFKDLIEGTLTKINDDTITSVRSYAFYSCSSLTSVNFPLVTSIEHNTFYSCSSLTSVNFPLVTSIGGRAFNSCRSLTSINFPLVTSIGEYAFSSCRSLTSINFPLVTSIGEYVFSSCTSLKSADFSLITSIDSSAFSQCSELTSLIIRKTNTICRLIYQSALNGTPIASGTGYIYVPSALIEDYKTATNWSTYAAQFRALEDYTVDGTTTGELDPTKI